MRPSRKQPGAVWRLLEQWSRDHLLKPNQAQMARAFGVSDSLLSNWKYCESAMQTDDMLRVAEATSISVDDLMRAVAEDSERVQVAVAGRRNTKRPPRGPRAQQGD